MTHHPTYAIGRLYVISRGKILDPWAFGIRGNIYRRSFTLQLKQRKWIVYWLDKP